MFCITHYSKKIFFDSLVGHRLGYYANFLEGGYFHSLIVPFSQVGRRLGFVLSMGSEDGKQGAVKYPETLAALRLTRLASQIREIPKPKLLWPVRVIPREELVNEKGTYVFHPANPAFGIDIHPVDNLQQRFCRSNPHPRSDAYSDNDTHTGSDPH